MSDPTTKTTTSPLLSKILRRQKIYTEANLSLKSVEAPQDCNVVVSTPIIVKDAFFSYSDLYIKRKEMLYSCEIRLGCFSELDTGVLIRNDCCSFVSDFVPFYKTFLSMPPVGVLLDLSKPRYKVNDSSKVDVCTYFPICDPVTSHQVYSYPKKTYASHFSRNSCSETKKRRATLDLDEIVPVAEDVLPQHNNRRISRARFASEGDVLILDPLLLDTMPRKRVKPPLSESEQNKIARITITYILAFFALVLTTYFIIYLA